MTGAAVTAHRAGRSGGRWVAGIVLGAAVGAAVSAVAAGLTWWSAEYRDPLSGPVSVSLDGRDLVVGMVPLVLVSLAGLGATFAARGLGRRLIGLIVLASGVAIAIQSVIASTGAPGQLAGALARPADPVGDAHLHLVGPVLGTLGGLLLIAVGALVAAGRGSRARMGAKYDAPGQSRPGGSVWSAPVGATTASAPGTSAPGTSAPGTSAPGSSAPGSSEAGPAAAGAGGDDMDPADWWKALDAGADPTDEPNSPTTDVTAASDPDAVGDATAVSDPTGQGGYHDLHGRNHHE